MPYLIAIFISFLLITHAKGDEFWTLDGEHYENVTLKRVEPDGLVVSYSDGVKKLKFNNLPIEIKKKYNYSQYLESEYLKQRKNYEIFQQKSRETYQSNNLSSNVCNTPQSISSEKNLENHNIKSRLIIIQKKIVINIVKWLEDFLEIKNEKSPDILTNAIINTPIPSPTIAQQDLPEEVVNKYFKKSCISNEDLCNIIEKYPKETISKIEKNSFKISGTVASIKFGEIDKKAYLELEKNGNYSIVIEININNYKESLKGSINSNYEHKLILINHQLFYSKKPFSKNDYESKYLICTEGQKIEGFLIKIQSINNYKIYFDEIGNINIIQ